MSENVRCVLRMRPQFDWEAGEACVQVVDSRTVEIKNSRNEHENFVYKYEF